MEKLIVRKGHLFVSQNGIFFYSKIFQQKTKEHILFSNISSLETRQQGKLHVLVKIKTTNKSYRVSISFFFTLLIFNNFISYIVCAKI